MSSHTAPRRGSRSQDDAPADADPRREALLEVAVALARGGRAPSVKTLADAAGVSRATVYRAFPGRGGLAAALVEAGALAARAEGPSTSERIVEACGRRVAVRGLLAVTVEEIAEEAGVSPVTVYRTFGDREGVLRAFVQSAAPSTSVGDLLEDFDAPVRETLTTFAAATIGFLRRFPALVRTQLAPGSDEAALIDRLRGRNSVTTRARLVRYFAEQIARDRIRDDANPVTLTLSFLGLVVAHGAIATLGLLSDGARSEHDAAREMVAIFLHGCGKEAP